MSNLDSAKLFICSGSLVLLFLGNIAEISYIEGPSMIPTANSGDLLVWDKISVLWKPYEIGELVVYRSPIDKNRVVLKRILGLPGDTIYKDPTKSNERIIVPEGHVWVQGDNYDMSRDSREYGTFSMGLLLGRVRFPFLKFVEMQSIQVDFDYFLQVYILFISLIFIVYLLKTLITFVSSHLDKQDGQERRIMEMEQRMEDCFNQLNYKIDALIKKQLRPPVELSFPITAPAAEPTVSCPPPPPPPPPIINTDTSIKITKSNKPLPAPKQESGMGTVLQELSSRSATLRRSARILRSPSKEETLRPLLKKTNIPLSPGGTIHLPKKKSESNLLGSTLRRQFRKAYDLPEEE
ncbi:hypothetical protein HDV04_000916 [Boothiomyces sp. JEL0838]|nr:hypothetical protein HDV04_000867 [Boothiomyces sp. JEL0838]KAJ3314193.1 hypothetical protein HDV04_000916 [Boothiomyces sp. JEL0838]